MSKGTFFIYFPTKEEVLLEVGASQVTWAAEQLAAVAAAPGPLVPRLVALCAELAGLVVQTYPSFRVHPETMSPGT